MKNKFFLFIVAVTFISLQSQAHAVLLTFSDRATFITTTGATSATGPLPNLGEVGVTPTTVGDITFSIEPGGSLYLGGGGHDWTPIIPGNDIAISGPETLFADLASSVVAFGFEFVEPSDVIGCNTTCFDSTFGVTLKDGLVAVGAFSFNVTDDVLAFVGVSSDVAFDRVEIRDLTATNDDEFYGEFFTTAAPTPGAPVPEPSTMLLLGSGLIGLIGFNYRRGKQAV